MLRHDQNSPSVFVVDDDKQFLDSLVVLLEGLGYSVHGFSSAKSFLKYYRAEMPGCLVLDIRMPRQSGLQMYEQLVRENKRLPVIFITAHADVSTAVAAMKSGAVEFLEKPFDRDTLSNRIQKALSVDAERRRKDARFAAIADRIEQLNDRERETLLLIQAGETNKAMAARLFLTERAVEMRRSTLMKKLQVKSLAELLELTTTHRILTEQRSALDQNQKRSSKQF
jgi:two-component system, LuxR family, response regulator FixJ